MGRQWAGLVGHRSLCEAMAHSDSGSINMAFLVQSDMALPVIQELAQRNRKMNSFLGQ